LEFNFLNNIRRPALVQAVVGPSLRKHRFIQGQTAYGFIERGNETHLPPSTLGFPFSIIPVPLQIYSYITDNT